MEMTVKRRFQEKDLPDMESILSDAGKLAADIHPKKTLFCREKGVASEKEYKMRMAREGRIMKHSVIGWNSVSETVESFGKIYDRLAEAGSGIDRFGVALDWVMGIPEKYRGSFQAGGSLILHSPEEWELLGQAVPVQIHMGDHMIGSLNSVENTILALEAGATTIGNISQYYTYEYPGIDQEKYRTIDTITAIALMGKCREQGTIIHSNLDDGYGGQFHDLANMIGFAKMERYIVEELLGARMAHCFGNLHSNPMNRIIFNYALDKINTWRTPGSMINGNTIDYGYTIPANYGAMGSYLLADILGEMHHPTGHAVAPVPVTEAFRIPSAQEIIDAHTTADALIAKAQYYMPMIDFDRIDHEAALLAEKGNVFFENMMNGLMDMHVDVNHAGELMAIIKAVGVDQLETNFGAGTYKPDALRAHVPYRAASIVELIEKKQEAILSNMERVSGKELSGINIVVGSTDVHEFGKEICKNVLLKAGANVFDLGTNVSIDALVDTVLESGSKGVLISTYNGIALSFAREMTARLRENHLDLPIVMGGRLNETFPDKEIPVDVADQIAALGINVDNNAEKIVPFFQAVVRA